MTAYYNEIDPHAAQWLRNLIAAGHIATGDVDERSITDVRADDLRGYRQCHFFAGIGGWSYALRLAGVPDDAAVWTGSCPCQPFSAAGKQRGSEDERHLWPAFFDLIRECRPGTVLGEQVAGAAGYAWWDHVAADLEGEGYAAAAADIGAHSVGAPHRRQRLYWVAHAADVRPRSAEDRRGIGAQPGEGWMRESARACDAGALADTDGRHPGAERQQRSGQHGQQPQDSGLGLVGDAESARSQGQRRERSPALGDKRGRQPGLSGDAWADAEWLDCTDGKARPTQRGIFPLAHGVSKSVGRSGDSGAPLDADATGEARVMRLRGYGNAIVPQVAAMFVRASMEAAA